MKTKFNKATDFAKSELNKPKFKNARFLIDFGLRDVGYLMEKAWMAGYNNASRKLKR